MRSEDDVHEVFRLGAAGLSVANVAARTGVSSSQVRSWLRQGETAVLGTPRQSRRRCQDAVRCTLTQLVPRPEYAYLLGQYLGDGHISTMRNGVHRLRITTCDDYPNIQDECRRAVEAVMPGRRVGRLPRQGCTDVSCYSRHWTCVFPQHGPGLKHERDIVLEPWQEVIAILERPESFLRGLIQSDGWRGINRVRGGNGSSYSYPQYQFSNRSDDIRQLFTLACDRIEIEWRRMNQWNIAVSKRQSVARLDEFIGPKS